MPDGNTLWLLILVAVAAMVMVGVDRRADSIQHGLEKLAASVAIGLLVYGLLQSNRTPGNQAVLVGIIAAFVTASILPSRSRHIPRRVRRQVIARWELETGKKYHPRKYELDHDVPFSKGGSHSEGNLRVRPRKVNRKKENKSPWWDVLGH